MTNAPHPLVSVMMPVYNGDAFLAAAIESILAQTFTDFEFIIVDDGSTDHTPALLAFYAERDARIRIIQHPRNLGLVAALNTGIEQAQGEYIARMDADDISLPERLAEQVEYLNAHSAVGVLGTAIALIDENGNTFADEHYPLSPGYARWSLFFYTCFAHPTVMMRKSVIAPLGFYQQVIAEDFDLWRRASHVTELSNLPTVLLKYRRSKTSITAGNQRELINSTIEINQRATLDLLGHEVSQDLIANLWFLLDRARTMSAPELQQTGGLIAELYRAYTARYPLTSTDARLVADGAANKLFYLAARGLRKAPLTSLTLVWRGLQISPLAFTSTITRLLRKPYAYLRPKSKV